MLSKEQEDVVIGNLSEILDKDSNENPQIKLKSLGFCEEHTEEILELITSTNARFHFYKSGMKPKQFSGGFENNRIFSATLSQLIGPKPNLKDRILKLLKLK